MQNDPVTATRSAYDLSPVFDAADVEVADLREAEDSLVERRPLRERALLDVVREVIDRDEPLLAHAIGPRALGEAERRVEPRIGALRHSRREVNERIADAADRVDSFVVALRLHRAAPFGCFERLFGRHHRAPRHRRDARAVRLLERRRVRLRIAIEQKRDVALAIEVDLLLGVLHRAREAKLEEELVQRLRIARRELDPLDSGNSDRVHFGSFQLVQYSRSSPVSAAGSTSSGRRVSIITATSSVRFAT